MTLERILFPVDFSEHCTAVAGYVEAMARGSGAQLTLLHVVEYPQSWHSEIESAVLYSRVKERRQEQLELYLERQFQDLAPSRLLLEGDPAAEIVKFAVGKGVSFIMIPTRGAGVFRRLLLGSSRQKCFTMRLVRYGPAVTPSTSLPLAILAKR